MNRRRFLQISGGTLVAVAAHLRNRATILYQDGAIALDQIRFGASELWIRVSDLPRVNGFELTPQGACRSDICVPFPQPLRTEGWFNLAGFARNIGEAFVADSGVWSFSEIPALRRGFYQSRIAPDFAIPDRNGHVVHLSDFRGKKILLLAWASWCGCRLDLPNWQRLYLELKDHKFEIVCCAQDTGGESAAGKWYDSAGATFTTLIDVQHSMSSAYHSINVPTAVWIDERGRVVRPAEPAWTTDQTMNLGGRRIAIEGVAYLAGLRDWVRKGEHSRYVLSDEEFRRRVQPRSASQLQAEASFKLAVWFHLNGKHDLAYKHWQEAQKLDPEEWNYHRQEWSFTPQVAEEMAGQVQTTEQPVLSQAAHARLSSVPEIRVNQDFLEAVS